MGTDKGRSPAAVQARTAKAVRARRHELGIPSQDEAARMSRQRISRAQWQRAESTRIPDPPIGEGNLLGICAVLGWREDAFKRLAAGEDPVLIESTHEGEDDEVIAAIRRGRRVRLPENQDL